MNARTPRLGCLAMIAIAIAVVAASSQEKKAVEAAPSPLQDGQAAHVTPIPFAEISPQTKKAYNASGIVLLGEFSLSRLRQQHEPRAHPARAHADGQARRRRSYCCLLPASEKSRSTTWRISRSFMREVAGLSSRRPPCRSNRAPRRRAPKSGQADSFASRSPAIAAMSPRRCRTSVTG